MGGNSIVIAASFAPIHERNNINLGQLMGDHAMLERLQNGESLPLSEFTSQYDDVTALILESGGLFEFSKRLSTGEIELPELSMEQRPMTMAEKIIARNLVGQPDGVCVKPDDLSSHRYREAILTNSQLPKFTHSFRKHMAKITN